METAFLKHSKITMFLESKTAKITHYNFADVLRRFFSSSSKKSLLACVSDTMKANRMRLISVHNRCLDMSCTDVWSAPQADFFLIFDSRNHIFLNILSSNLKKQTPTAASRLRKTLFPLVFWAHTLKTFPPAAGLPQIGDCCFLLYIIIYFQIGDCCFL